MTILQASYQQKLKWLAIAVVPILLICFRMSFYKTFQQRNRNKQLEAEIATLRSKSDSNDYYRQMEGSFQKMRSNYLMETSSDDNRIMNFIASYNGGGIQILQYSPLATSADHIWTRSFVLQGPFGLLNSLVYQLEQTNKIGRVSSVSFQKAVLALNGNKKEVLQCTLYIQNILHEKDSSL